MVRVHSLQFEGNKLLWHIPMQILTNVVLGLTRVNSTVLTQMEATSVDAVMETFSTMIPTVAVRMTCCLHECAF